MIEALFQVLFEIIGEALLQIVFEVLAELGLRSVTEPFRKRPHPAFAAIGYGLLGLLAGAVSLWPFPHNLVPGAWRLVNLALAPVAAGLVMCLLGAWRLRRGQDLIRLDRFSYGYLFALGLALVRFWFAK